jgi:hypothetical protein
VADRPGGTDGGGFDENAEPTPLGAAAPVTVGREPRKSRIPTGWRPKKPKNGIVVLVIVAALIVLALAPAFIGGLKKTPRDRVGISYGGGPFEGTHYQRIVQPGSSLFVNGFFDPLFLYPSDQVNYIISKKQGLGAQQAPDFIVAPTKDRIAATYQVAVYFKLNTDKLRTFHEQLGLRYKAYTSTGWYNLIRDTFRQQIENALQEETRRVDVSELYGNADLLVQIQDRVQRKLTQRLDEALGNHYFCSPTFEPGRRCGDPTFIIKSVDIPANVAKAFQDNRTSAIQILTKQNEIQQREAEAQAIRALGLTGQEYDVLKGIESGKISFWVLPNNAGVTIGTPGSPGGAGTPTPGGSGSGTTSTTRARGG